MFNTIIEGINFKVNLYDSVQQKLEKNNGDPEKIYEQVVAFSDKVLNSKNDTELFIVDDETGIGLVLEVHWTSDVDILVNVMLVIGLEKVFVEKVLQLKKLPDLL